MLQTIHEIELIVKLETALVHVNLNLTPSKGYDITIVLNVKLNI